MARRAKDNPIPKVEETNEIRDLAAKDAIKAYQELKKIAFESTNAAARTTALLKIIKLSGLEKSINDPSNRPTPESEKSTEELLKEAQKEQA